LIPQDPGSVSFKFFEKASVAIRAKALGLLKEAEINAS